MNLLDTTSNQLSRFKIKNWVEINDDKNGTYDKKNLKFKITILNASLCDYNDACDYVTITAVRQGAYDAAIAADRNYKEVIFKTMHHLLSE